MKEIGLGDRVVGMGQSMYKGLKGTVVDTWDGVVVVDFDNGERHGWFKREEGELFERLDEIELPKELFEI